MAERRRLNCHPGAGCLESYDGGYSDSLPPQAKRAAALALSPEPRLSVSDSRQIQTTHLTATALNGDSLAVVTFTNGRCGVTRNGELIVEMEWDLSRMSECTAALIRLAGLDGNPS